MSEAHTLSVSSFPAKIAEKVKSARRNSKNKIVSRSSAHINSQKRHKIRSTDYNQTGGEILQKLIVGMQPQVAAKYKVRKMDKRKHYLK
jgi:hypothetical protein